MFVYCCVWKKVKNSSSLLFSSVHLLLVGQKKRGERSFMVWLRVPRSILFTKKLFHPHIERLFVYYHSHNIPKTLFFLSFGENQNLSGERKLVPRGKKKISFFFYFREGGFEPSYTRRGDLTPKKKKKINFHDWIRCTRSELRWRGVLLGIHFLRCKK